MGGLFVLLAEHAISRLRGTDGWEAIAAGVGVDLPVDAAADFPATVMNDVADELARVLSIDRPTALRAIGEHSFPLVLDTVPDVFEVEDQLSPARHADHVFQQLHRIIDELTRGAPAAVAPQLTWTREGQRREFTARCDASTADLIHGQILALMDWLDVDVHRMQRHDLGNGLTRWELWYG